MLGTISLSVLYIIHISFNLYNNTMRVDTKYPCFTVEEAQAQKREVTCIR